MAIPIEIRERKNKSTKSVLTWTISQLICLGFLYQLLFHWGDALLLEFSKDTKHEGRTSSSSSSEEEVRWIVFGMIALRTFSQIFWGLYLQSYDFPVGMVIGVTIFNGVCDSLVILGTLWNRTKTDQTDLICLFVFIFGIALERFSELQRHAFKSMPGNKGAMHTSGLYSICVHPNYLGYIIWRAALVGISHLWWLQWMPAMIMYDFITGDVRNQKERNIKKYGETFKRYWDSTPKLVPGIY
jgi:protein-S-isoprenylcysteine O-methyltransferase Ste14